jgi:hypothetical protein
MGWDGGPSSQIRRQRDNFVFNTDLKLLFRVGGEDFTSNITFLANFTNSQPHHFNPAIMSADAEMPDADAVEEEAMMYGHGALTEAELDEKLDQNCTLQYYLLNYLPDIQTDHTIYTRLFLSMSYSRHCFTHLSKPKRKPQAQLFPAEGQAQEVLQN